jgi:hypothetical protein
MCLAVQYAGGNRQRQTHHLVFNRAEVLITIRAKCFYRLCKSRRALPSRFRSLRSF